jgi:hypothetical protein
MNHDQDVSRGTATEEPLGEIIESSTAEFVAESKIVHEPPSLGQFVRVGGSNSEMEIDDPFETAPLPRGAVFGLVVQARTASREPGRRAASFGLTGEELRREQPQLWQLLATDFHCVIVGHEDRGELRPYVPPKPPRTHALVYPSSDQEVCRITQGLGFVRTILSSQACPNPDEMIAAGLRIAIRCQGGDEAFKVRAGRELALLLRDDYERLSAILRNLE